MFQIIAYLYSVLFIKESTQKNYEFPQKYKAVRLFNNLLSSKSAY